MPIIPRANEMVPKVTHKALIILPFRVFGSAFSMISSPPLSRFALPRATSSINQVHYGEVRVF